MHSELNPISRCNGNHKIAIRFPCYFECTRTPQHLCLIFTSILFSNSLLASRL